MNPLTPYQRFPSYEKLPAPVAERLMKAAIAEVGRSAEHFLQGPLMQGAIKSEDAAESMLIAAGHLFEDEAAKYFKRRDVLKSTLGVDLDAAETAPQPTLAERRAARQMRLETERRAEKFGTVKRHIAANKFGMELQISKAIGEEADVITKRAELNVPIPQLDHVAKSRGWTYAGEENHGPVSMRVYKRGGLDLGLDALSDEWVIASPNGVVRSGKGAESLNTALCANPNRRS